MDNFVVSYTSEMRKAEELDNSDDRNDHFEDIYLSMPKESQTNSIANAGVIFFFIKNCLINITHQFFKPNRSLHLI